MGIRLKSLPANYMYDPTFSLASYIVPYVYRYMYNLNIIKNWLELSIHLNHVNFTYKCVMSNYFSTTDIWKCLPQHGTLKC